MKDDPHKTPAALGILLVNLGTPDAPTPTAVRRYLKEFLSDPRVVQLPKLLWRLVLYFLILPFRSHASAKLYQSIWTDEGSPLLTNTQAIAEKLRLRLQDNPQPMIIEVGMRYGQPNYRDALDRLREHHLSEIVVIPLFPQYSNTTTGSVFAAVTQHIQSWKHMPALRFIDHYADHPAYIQALGDSIRQHWQTHEKPDKLLFSFHGLPERNFTQGDPYSCYCRKTARLVAENLQLTEDQWNVVFQSRFGKARWLQPYCEATLKELAASNMKSVHVICPGFSVDCLETLEEMALRNRETFIESGGTHFSYIPALNASDAHIDLFTSLIFKGSS